MAESANNAWCDVLGMEPPRLESVVGHREAGPFALLLVALLERGEAMTLEAVAERLEEAGAGPVEKVLRSLKRCRPGRPPVHRHGELYHLDPHHGELDLWVFRLGLRPPKVPPLRVVRPEPEPLAGVDEPLRLAEVEEAFVDFYPYGPWSAQRLSLAVLDAHGGALPPERLVAWLESRMKQYQPVRVDSIRRWRAGAITEVGGEWRAVPGHPALTSARRAFREHIQKRRAQAAKGPDPVVMAVQRKRHEARQRQLEAELAGLSRVLVHAYPHERPLAVALVDIGRWELTTYDLTTPDSASGPTALERVREHLAGHGLIAGWQVRPQLAGLGFDAGALRLGELGPPQKTARLSEGGRPRKLTQELLIRSCCNIPKPLVGEARLRSKADKGDGAGLAELLATEARSLALYYQYGRLHGHLRVLWRGWQTVFEAPWSSWNETSIRGLLREASATGRDVEMVLGKVEDWSDPWGESVVRRARGGGDPWSVVLEDWNGWILDIFDVQLARLAP